MINIDKLKEAETLINKAKECNKELNKALDALVEFGIEYDLEVEEYTKYSSKVRWLNNHITYGSIGNFIQAVSDEKPIDKDK